jgi:hypothetical protein
MRFSAASELLARKVRIQKVEQIGKEVQPKQAAFHDGPMPFLSISSLQAGSNVAISSHADSFCGAHCSG